MLKRVYLEITNVCNLACHFCPGTARPPHFLSPEEFSALAEKLRGETEYLYFHVMGEPLLHPQLPLFLDIAADKGFKVCLTTNGTLLPHRLDELLGARNLHKISVSLHSFEGNDCLGGDLEGYIRGAAKSCAKLAQRGTICAFRLWNNGGAQEKNGEVIAHLAQVLAVDIGGLTRDVRGNFKLGERLYLEEADKFDWPDPAAEAGGVEFCLGLRQQAAILCDGTVVPCCLDSEGRLALGNLFAQSWRDILDAPRARAMVEGFSRRRPTEELCRRCGYARRFSKG